MKAGPMRERITVQSKSVTRDAIGAEVVTWSDVATVWADAKPVRARELVAADQRQQEFEVRFLIRYLAGLDRENRVIWRGQPYAIVGDPIDVEARKRMLEIMAVSGVRDGR